VVVRVFGTGGWLGESGARQSGSDFALLAHLLRGGWRWDVTRKPDDFGVCRLGRVLWLWYRLRRGGGIVRSGGGRVWLAFGAREAFQSSKANVQADDESSRQECGRQENRKLIERDKECVHGVFYGAPGCCFEDKKRLRERHGQSAGSGLRR